MPIEKAPASPVPANYKPEGGIPHKVQDSDDWWSLARKANNMDVWDLIEFNFKTRSAPEVNWYLRRNVGCKKTTKDGKNYMFSSNAMPGIVYLPPDPKQAKPTNIWFGIAVKGGGHFFLVGKDTVEGWLVSVDNYENNFFLNVDGWRLGPGLGGGVGVALVIVTSMRNPNALHGHMVGGKDFQASLGAKWGTLAKGVSKLSVVQKLAQRSKFATKVGKGAITLAEWEKTRELIKGTIGALGIDLDAAEPQVEVIDLPGVGTGLELSAYFNVGTIQVHGVSYKEPGK
jgi:hypothetical protein